jgi:hypothetical protein
LTKQSNNSNVKEWAVARIDLSTRETRLVSAKGTSSGWKGASKFTAGEAEDKVKELSDATDEQFIFYKCLRSDGGGKKSWAL